MKCFAFPVVRRTGSQQFQDGHAIAASLQFAAILGGNLGAVTRRVSRSAIQHMANYFATKPLDALMQEADQGGEHGLRRALGPVNLVSSESGRSSAREFLC
jgi:hypothetical protein